MTLRKETRLISRRKRRGMGGRERLAEFVVEAGRMPGEVGEVLLE